MARASATMLLFAATLMLPVGSAWEVVLLESEERGRWSVEERVEGAIGVTQLWLPADAAHATFDPPTTWRVAGPDTIVADVNGSLRVTFALDRAGYPVVLIPEGAEPRVVRFVPLPGRSAPEGPFVAGTQGGRTTYTANLGPDSTVRALPEVSARGVDARAWLAVSTLALLTLAVGLAWTNQRLRREGDPQTFLQHLGEVQVRLRVTLLFFAIFNVLYFTLGLTWRPVALGEIGVWTLPVPRFGSASSLSADVFHAMAARFTPEGVALVTTRPVEALVAQIEIVLLLALVTVLPLLAWQIASFLAPALGARERRFAWRVIPVAVGLFLAGILFGYLLMVPLMIRTLYEYAFGLGVTPLLAVGELVGFAALMLLVFATAFELPLVMAALSRFGLVAPAAWTAKWRHAVVGMFLLAAVVTPDASVVNQILVAFPLLGLYVAGAAASRWRR